MGLPPAIMEFVFVVPREVLFPACYPQGFQRFESPEDGETLLAELERHGFFVERERAERTPAWKQVIPYCVVTSGERVLLMKRRAKGGESRLHDKLTIGVGGHINPVDRELDERGLVRAAARREIAEEIQIEGEYDLRLAGYLNDDSNPVGAVHLGLVFAASTSSTVRIREEDVLEGQLVGLEELRASRARGANLETWSSLLVDHVESFTAAPTRPSHPTHNGRPGLVSHTATTRTAK
jgi:predicted NUDIX family phosphoesterase